MGQRANLVESAGVGGSAWRCSDPARQLTPHGIAAAGSDRVVSKDSHDPRCLLSSNGIRRSQLTSELFDFLDGAGRDGLDLDND